MVKPDRYQKGILDSALPITAASLITFCIICPSVVASTVWGRTDISVCFPVPKTCNENHPSSLFNHFARTSGHWALLLLSQSCLRLQRAWPLHLEAATKRRHLANLHLRKPRQSRCSNILYLLYTESKNLTDCQASDQRRATAPDLAQKRNSHAF